jgi:hypothetical protein
MSKLLDLAIEKVRALPEPDQDEIAELLLNGLSDSDKKWEALFADPRSEAVLEQLWAEAEQEIARGEVFDLSCTPMRT